MCLPSARLSHSNICFTALQARLPAERGAQPAQMGSALARERRAVQLLRPRDRRDRQVIEAISLYLLEGFLKQQTKDAFMKCLRTLHAPLLQSTASVK